jgi:hypothetical protein
MTSALFIGTFISAFGIASSAFVLRAATLKEPRKLSPSTEKLLNGDENDALEKIFSGSDRIPVRDLISLYWNSRFLVQEAHSLWLLESHDAATKAMLEMEEDAHAKTEHYIRQHILERLHLTQRAYSSQTSSLFLLDSYSEQLTILVHMQQRSRDNGLAKFMGAF